MLELLKDIPERDFAHFVIDELALGITEDLVIGVGEHAGFDGRELGFVVVEEVCEVGDEGLVCRWPHVFDSLLLVLFFRSPPLLDPLFLALYLDLGLLQPEPLLIALG